MAVRADLSGELRAHLRRLASEPFEFGHCDCLLALADWVRAVTGVDLGAQYRGTYRTTDEWLRIVHHAGGMQRMVENLLLRVGWGAVDPPVAGDVGLVDAGPKIGIVGALRGDGLWHLKLNTGLVAIRTPVIVRAWGPR
jgi:hypothetical protein